VTFDLVCAGLVAILAIWGLWRGLVRQIFGLAGFVGGIILARLFADPFGQAFAKDLNLPVGVATAAAAIVIFIATAVAAKIAGGLLANVFKGGFTGMVDRLGGLVLGAAKGVLVAWAVASIVTLMRPHFSHVEHDTPLAGLDLQHSHVIAAANDTNLITELRKGDSGKRAMR
jgi:membrane protein required for colicin V production